MTAEWKTISALIERRYKAAATIEMKPDRKLRVGVTIHIRDGQQSIWENGIFQNCVFLVQLLNLSPEVERAVLVNGSGAREVHPSMMFDQVGVEMIDLQSALETLDVVVEMSSQVPEDWLEKFRARGGRIAWMRCGNDLVIDIERAMNNLPHAGLCSAKIYDAVWTLPEYAHTCVDYFAITTRAPVKIVPHLWTPEFFDKSIATLPQGVRFGYQPGKPRWRICCFEPNMCMVKTSITPMLVCEEAYRKTPARFESIRVCNTLKSKENPAFARFARYLDIVNHGIASFEGRFAVYEYMAHFGDCIVSHHWENGQNYLYYEALHGGYPLIHNSEFIRDLGYFYPDFDCQAGGDALIRAFENHDANLAEYRKKSSEFLKTLDIRHPPNIEAYTAELLALFAAIPHRPRSKKNANKTNFETVADQKPPESGTAARRLDGIYVINLDRRPDRLQRFSKNHPDLAGRFKRFAACDGKTLQLTPALSRLFAPNNFNWHKATMGCAMSHLALWKNLSQRPGESWLIMEDDARLSPGWESAVELALKGSSLPEDWEVLFLGGVLPRHRETFEKNVEQLGGGIARVRPDCVLGNNPPGYFHFCAYAYLLSHRGALRLLDLVKQGGGIWMQADFLLACSKPGLGRKIFFLHPLRAESFQDSEPGFAQPYGEGGPSAEVVDSDIWREQDRFTEEQVAAVRNVSHPLNHPAALATQKTSIPAPPKIPPAIDKIWVINLERRRDRLEKFQAGHPDIVGEIEVLKAYDGRTLRLTPKIARLFAPNEFRWNKATMGCSLSHLDLWYKLANEPEENARYLILEDDARLLPGWRDTVECSFASGDVPADWDVLYLGGVLPKNADAFQKCKEKVSGNIFQVAPNSWFVQKPPNRYFHFGAFAYLLSKKGAKKLLEFIRLSNGIWPQADYLLGYVFPETHPIRLTHYFFDPLLAISYQDLETGFQKSYSEARGEGKIDSDIWMKTNCFDEKIAKCLFSSSEPYDISGALAEARSQTRSRSHAENAKISLLHATRGRPYEAVKARELWFRTARHPQRIEHFFAIDDDDKSSDSLKVHAHVLQNCQGFSVGAWNLAASHCSGDILIQLSDDWIPPDGWDDLIAGRLDIHREEVLWISDGHRKDDLICMAILTRCFYKRHGLFDPAYKNVFSDDDFTIRAKKAGAVVDARDILIKHEHPHAGAKKPMDATYARGNQRSEYMRAGSIFKAKHFPEVYSQNDEQIVIQRYFWEERGTLWDFGCNDGITLSNSHYLLKNQGWTGTLVDASKTCIERAKEIYKERKDIQLLNIGMAESKGILDFYESGTHLGKDDVGLVSSFKKDVTARWQSTTQYHHRQVQCYDFNSFLTELAQYKTADFISIDVEGLDYEILSSIDLYKTCTRLVCVEHNGQNIGRFVDYGRRYGMHVLACNAENLIMGRLK